MKKVFGYGGENPFLGAKSEDLIQVDQSDGRGKLFTVTYGLQRKEGLTYAQAAKELGECIFHLEACNGKIDGTGR